ncbi:MAG: choice-of-anchor R domain-containing protein [Candidatus Paceibacterota bacterium]|jgi:hypothetical protein
MPSQYKRGQVALVAVLLFLTVSGTIVFGIASPFVNHLKGTFDYRKSKESYFLAESVVEDSVYRLKNNLNLPATNILTLNGNSSSADITPTIGGKIIDASGSVNNLFRSIRASVFQGSGVSFNYGIQTGYGGITLNNNSTIVGNIYANGNVVGASGVTVSGSVIAANSAPLSANVINDIPIPVTYNIAFRKASANIDLAQSFQVTSGDPLNKVQLYIKKTGSPGSPTLRIVNDNAGNPGSTTYISATLSSGSVGTSYGWVDVIFTGTPFTLTPGLTYWIVIDNSASSPTAYYTIGANTALGSYQTKLGSFGGSWSLTSPSGQDIYFKIYLGGITSTISNLRIGGDAWAHTVTGSTVTGTIYCQVGSSNNKACNTSRPDPDPQSYAISDSNIQQWKDEAVAGGTMSGSYSYSSDKTLGPKKITGNLNIGDSTLTVSGTLWIQGNLDLSNNVHVNLSSAYGANSGMIVVDGTVSLSNNVEFAGSGQIGSYIMVLTTSSSTDAISVGNNAGAVILYAPNGTIEFSNNAGAKEASGNKLVFANGSTITYESGLANLNFSSGPSGGWDISSWKEVE